MLKIEELNSQLQFVLKNTDFPELGEKYEGKVRDNYSKKQRRILIATDRLSAFDRIITHIPFKGQVLTEISKFWFENTQDILPNHILDFPDPNVMVARECHSLPVEIVVRGYLTGVTSTSVWTHYQNGVRNFCGNALPDGLKRDQKFEHPIITPSTKAEKGAHDTSASREEILAFGAISAADFDYIAQKSLELFARGQEIAAKQGIILVDTKYEFGKDENGEIILIDEIHTPDSSRFWFADQYESRFQSGESQKKIDKEYLREWLAEKGFLGEGEIPAIPDPIKVETARRYIEAFELITGKQFVAKVGDPITRIKENLLKYF